MEPIDNPNPTEVFKEKGFFETTKGKSILISGLSTILFVILLISLNYFDIISPSQLASLPKKITNATGNPVSISLIPQDYGFKAGELTLTCPVDSAFCKSERLVKVNNQDAVSYKAAPNSAILNLSPISSLENVAVLTNKDTGKKYFYESVVSKDGSCYTIAYTLPSDATFGNILDLKTLLMDKRVATLGSETFTVAGQEANVLIQVRNSPLDPGVPCSLIRKSPEFFKSF